MQRCAICVALMMFTELADHDITTVWILRADDVTRARLRGSIMSRDPH